MFQDHTTESGTVVGRAQSLIMTVNTAVARNRGNSDVPIWARYTSWWWYHESARVPPFGDAQCIISTKLRPKI